MTSDQRDDYNKGKQFRLEGRPVDSCTHRYAHKAIWRKAGWHDLDLEKGNRQYFDDNRERVKLCTTD